MDFFVFLLLSFISFFLHAHGGTVSTDKPKYVVQKGQDITLRWNLVPENGEIIVGLHFHNGTVDKKNKLWTALGGEYSELREEMFGARFIADFDSVNSIVSATIKNTNLNDSSTIVLKGIFLIEKDFKGTPFSEAISFEVKDGTTNPGERSNDDSSSSSNNNTGKIVGGVIGAIVVILIIIFVIYYLKCHKTSNKNRKSNGYDSNEEGFQYHKEPVTQYASPNDLIPKNQDSEQPIRQKYDELGPGGRVGPKDHVVRSQYAEAKTEESDHSDHEMEDANLVSDSIIV